MAVVQLGPNGEVTVLVPPTPEEIVEAEAALLRVVQALAEMAAREDYAAWRARLSDSRTSDEEQGAVETRDDHGEIGDRIDLPPHDVRRS